MLEGMPGIQRNLRAMVTRMEKQAADAADETAKYLANTAKQIGPWTDRTANLRNSINGTSGSVPGGYRIVVSESMTYAPFVEEGTRRSRPYPALWPAVAETVNSGTAMAIFRRHLHL